MAHPEAKTSLLSQTTTMVCLVLVPMLLVDLINFDNAWAREGALCLEHFLGNIENDVVLDIVSKVGLTLSVLCIAITELFNLKKR